MKWLVIGLVASLFIVLVLKVLFGNRQCNYETIPRILKATGTSRILNIPPRRMAGWGFFSKWAAGMCGEVSLQMCATYYGNYISQEQIAKAAGGTFLIGINDNVCIPALHLVGEFWPPIFGKGAPDIYAILAYIKQQLDQNYPVILGLYCNESSGDPSFDHQCVAMGYEMDGNTVKTIYLLDTYQIRIIPIDCSLAPYECLSGTDACQTPTAPDCSGQPFPPNLPVGPPAYPVAPFPKFYKRRIDFASADQQAPYSVAMPNVMGCKDATSGDDLGNALYTVKGNNDPKNELFPCWLAMSSCYEPNWTNEDQIFAPPGPISCKVYIQGLTRNEKYSLLRFDNPKDVPTDGDFIHSKGYTLREDFVACGSTNMIEVTDDPKVWPFMSDGTYFFRCVKTNGVPFQQNFPFGTNRTDKSHAPLPPVPSMASAGTWNMTGWHTRRFGDVIRSRIQQYQRKLQGLSHKAGQLLKKPSLFTNVVGQCKAGSAIAPSNIACGGAGTGTINQLWHWKFPDVAWNGQKIGCMTIWLTVQDPGLAEAANCVNFTVDNDDSDPNPPIVLNSVTGCIIYDMDGSNPRFYIEDVTNFFTYSFSPDPQNPDGSFTMLSQDGVTYSTLTPVSA